MGFGVLTLTCITVLLASLGIPPASCSCNSDGLALYKLTFEGLWTKARFPKGYPGSRPKAEWSSIIGRSHSVDYNLFSKGRLISKSLQSFVEYGETSSLDGEGQGHSFILDSFTSPPLEKGYGISETQFYSDSSRHEVSFVAKIVPSPDWFVGVDSVTLCNDNIWIESAEFDLWPLDAGTQQGYTYSSPRWRSDPQEVITEITNLFPNRTADAFYYPQFSSLPPIAKVKFQRQQLYYEAGVSSTVARTEERLTTPAQSYLRAAVKEEKAGTILKPPVLHLAKFTTVRPTALTVRTPITITPQRVRTTTTMHPTTVREASTTTQLTTTGTNLTESTVTYVEGTTSTTINYKVLALLKLIKNNSHPASVNEKQLNDGSQSETSTHAFKVAPIIPEDEEFDDISEERGSGLEVPSDDDGSSLSRHSGYSVQESTTTDAITTESYISNDILPPDYEQESLFEEKVCLVTSWSEWSACSRTCGYGSKTRTRNVVKWTGNVPCPDLQMEQLCGSMKKCNWNHFSMRFNSTKSILGHKKRIRQKKPIQIRNADGETSAEGNKLSAALTGSSGTWRSRNRAGVRKPNSH